ncbi:Protein phosphatase methylesterase 1 [Schistosoma japonicum]|nr:Protein phosphatase methylesterase 1 [Schistosoma japonicum]
MSLNFQIVDEIHCTRKSEQNLLALFAQYKMSSCPTILTSEGNCKDSQISDLADESYSPVKWNEYFNIRDDIELEGGTFRIYRRGVEGPLLFFLHGGGFSALTWAVLSTLITDQVKCQCLAVDMRGHGDTKCLNDNDLSIDTLSKDVIKIIFAMYPMEAPPIILVGHSMGGAVAVHVACKRTIPSLAGSALSSLRGMTAFLRSRPQNFRSLPQAIEWSLQIRNVNSARISFPGQLKRITTGQTATSELDDGVAVISQIVPSVPITSASDGRVSSVGRLSSQPLVEDSEMDDVRNSAIDTSFVDSQEWFSGLSKLFLSIPEPKLLLLADADRLDKDLMIGQMQGKFQVQLFPRTGHAVQEDAPDRVAECLARFLVRNRFTEARSDL